MIFSFVIAGDDLVLKKNVLSATVINSSHKGLRVPKVPWYPGYCSLSADLIISLC